jgi:hypothetical protein
VPYANYYKCTIPDCNGAQRGRGFCFKHYQRFMKFGDPLYSKHVENEDKLKYIHEEVLTFKSKTECLLWPFSKRNGRGYITGGPVSRVVCKMAHGEPPTPEHDAAHFYCGNERCVNPHHLRWSQRRSLGLRSAQTAQ